MADLIAEAVPVRKGMRPEVQEETKQPRRLLCCKLLKIATETNSNHSIPKCKSAKVQKYKCAHVEEGLDYEREAAISLHRLKH